MSRGAEVVLAILVVVTSPCWVPALLTLIGLGGALASGGGAT